MSLTGCSTPGGGLPVAPSGKVADVYHAASVGAVQSDSAHSEKSR